MQSFVEIYSKYFSCYKKEAFSVSSLRTSFEPIDDLVVVQCIMGNQGK